jgi:hypothetical protein
MARVVWCFLEAGFEAGEDMMGWDPRDGINLVALGGVFEDLNEAWID